uniref:Uncharacterized protein n=1 Tax=Magallana gigas TaxID=29159 RepID=A0A8W8MF65_MAGGI
MGMGRTPVYVPALGPDVYIAIHTWLPDRYLAVFISPVTDSYAMHRPEYGTSAGTRLFDRGPYNSTPVDNYPSGDGKSMIWRGPSHYVPSERRWTDYHQYRSLPRDTRRDAKEMQSEDQWVDFMRQRDTPSGYYHKDIGLLQTGVPECRLFGYTRDLPSMPPRAYRTYHGRNQTHSSH